MDMWRVEEGMPAAGVERARHMDQVAGAVQHRSPGPVPFEPREEALLTPAPDQAGARRFRCARRTKLPKSLQQRHHGAQIAGL